MMLFAVCMFTIITIGSCVCSYNIATRIVHSMIADRMDAELDRLLTVLGGTYWENRDGGLYCGLNYYGNGEVSEARLTKFLDFEHITGTFCYTFILDKDATNLGVVGATKTRLAYTQGHYLRVAGSTLSPDGTSIVGTYMSKSVADILDAKGRYEGVANVEGGLIYCIYETLNDKDGNIVGAIVVGRSLNAINKMVYTYTIYQLAITLFIILLASFFMIKKLRNVTASIVEIDEYIEKIDAYHLPDHKLELPGIDEINEIGHSINNMVDKIAEANRYRTLSETDQLTKMHNRLFISMAFERVRKSVITENKLFALEIVDLDYFKQFNDNYGHNAGDEALLLVAETLMSVSDDEKVFAARWGGDEFLLMFIGLDENEVAAIQKRVYDTIHARAMKHEFSKVNNIVTVTQGAYVFNSILDLSFDDLFAEADKVLYAVKERSRDDYAVKREGKE